MTDLGDPIEPPQYRVEQIISYFIGKAIAANREQPRPGRIEEACAHAAKAIVFEYDLEPAKWPPLH